MKFRTCMFSGAAILALGCFVSDEGNEAAGGSGESVEQEIKDAADNVGDDLVADVKADFAAAGAWLQSEWDKLEPEVMNDFGAIVDVAIKEAEEGEGLGEIVADVLDRIENGVSDAVKAINSDVITASVALKYSAP